MKTYPQPKITATSILGFFGEYRWLSNFYLSDLKIGDEIYPSSEHAYQAFKTKNLILRKKIKTIPLNKVKGYCRTITLREGWEDRNLRIKAMWKVTTAKYRNKKLRLLLLETAGKHLEELNYWGDKYWGTVEIKGERVGENMLGQVLMAYRDYLLGFINKSVCQYLQALVIRKMKTK